MGNHTHQSASAWWSTHRPTRRRLIQVYAALLYNAHLKGFIQGNIYTGSIKNICVPGFNCYSCPGAIGACPLGALQNALASSGNRAPFYILGILMLFGLTLGRTICGWLCPLGLIQELLHKLPTPKLPKSCITRFLSYVKYVLLAVFVIGIPLYYSPQHIPMPAFCKYICPAGTLEGAIGLLANPVNADKFSMLHIFFTRKFVLLVLILTACIFIYRSFCRFLCPLGAIYGLFSRLSLLGVKVEASACTHCGLCVAHCKMDVQRVGDHECIHCGNCINTCPANAISIKCGHVTLQEKHIFPEKDVPASAKKTPVNAYYHRVIYVAALVLLAGVLCVVNRTKTSATSVNSQTEDPITPALSQAEDSAASTLSQAEDPDASTLPQGEDPDASADRQETDPSVSDALPVGNKVGMRCPDFTVPLYGPDGGNFMPHTGKVTIINFWATWCTPCVGELPYFQQLQDTYGDSISIVAIHSKLVTDDVDAFLGTTDYTLPFALDETGEVITSLGGSTMLPMTVVLDTNGIIIYNQVGSITYDLLDSLVAPLIS